MKLYVWTCTIDHAPAHLIAMAESIDAARVLIMKKAGDRADDVKQIMLVEKPTVYRVPSAFVWIE